MRAKVFFSLAVVLIMFCGFADATVKVRTLGNPKTAFYSPDIRSEDDLRKMLQVRREEIREILRQANWPGSADDLLNALDRGPFSEMTVDSQTHLPFMAARKNGRPKAMIDVQYEGPAMAAYYIDFQSGGNNYRFIAPKICSNFWIEERAAEQPAPAPAPPPPPAPAPPPAPEVVPPAPVPPPPPPPPPVKHRQLLFGAAFIGKERSEDFIENTDVSLGSSCKTIVGFKGGVLPRINDRLEGELSVGGKFVIGNTQDEDDNLFTPDDETDRTNDADKTFFVDAAVHAVFHHGFVGGGVSFWDLNSDQHRTASLLFQFGFGPPQVQITFEARAPFENLGDVSNHYMFWGGLRIHP